MLSQEQKFKPLAFCSSVASKVTIVPSSPSSVCSDFWGGPSLARSRVQWQAAKSSRTSLPMRVRSSASDGRAVVRAGLGGTVASLSPCDVAVVLLAGGVGSRMKADRPKQFLELDGRTVLEHSLDLFCSLSFVSVIVLVIDPSYRDSFSAVCEATAARHAGAPPIVFADPGKERQDSVLSGLCTAEQEATASGVPVSLVAVHDSARPLVSAGEVENVVSDAREHGAAVLGVPCKATVKESADGQFVLRTVPRERLWEVQTPQVVRPQLLRRGFEYVEANGLAVTDDVSVVEHLGEPVKLTAGEYTNLKITTPEDLDIAMSILKQRAAAVAPL